MSFTEPAKTSDGRYYVKAFEKKLVQLNGVTLASSLADPASVTFTLDQVREFRLRLRSSVAYLPSPRFTV